MGQCQRHVASQPASQPFIYIHEVYYEKSENFSNLSVALELLLTTFLLHFFVKRHTDDG